MYVEVVTAIADVLNVNLVDPVIYSQLDILLTCCIIIAIFTHLVIIRYLMLIKSAFKSYRYAPTIIPIPHPPPPNIHQHQSQYNFTTTFINLTPKTYLSKLNAFSFSNYHKMTK